MKFFIFMVFIPAAAGVISSIYGVGWFSNDGVGIAAAINIPICLASSLIYYYPTD